MARKPLIAGNWKMNNTVSEAVVLAQEISNGFERDWLDHVDVAVCPPYVDLKPVRTVFEFDKLRIAVGAQNVFWEPSGAYTGEISIPMLREIGCGYCIVGHSERRELFGETNEDINRKVRALVAEQLNPVRPIVCVGESLAVRDEGSYLAYVDAQVRAAFAGVDVSEVAEAVIAYEPIWAIGTGRTATPEQAQEVCAAIRATVTELFGAERAVSMRVLYGGSMNEGNASLLLAQPDIDGGLIGGASLQAKSFLSIVREAL
ncbi:triose-phosphate isomerase [Adlercreutzia murintestinalis]|uniref:triose-phosphate isomerase n=1 Tax=Adlercreutzia murintestinalis TaxID=2941325 RepID=UPI00203F3298|nr:triose-phosphate isomerase [Adlercreutzia murintestinalis]